MKWRKIISKVQGEKKSIYFLPQSFHFYKCTHTNGPKTTLLSENTTCLGICKINDVPS
jgi:hypothetical protein